MVQFQWNFTKKGKREMNANELADELENTYPFVGVMEVAAIMLRQQQTEIEALKVKAHEWYLIAMEKAQEK